MKGNERDKLRVRKESKIRVMKERSEREGWREMKSINIQINDSEDPTFENDTMIAGRSNN